MTAPGRGTRRAGSGGVSAAGGVPARGTAGAVPRAVTGGPDPLPVLRWAAAAARPGDRPTTDADLVVLLAPAESGFAAAADPDPGAVWADPRVTDAVLAAAGWAPAEALAALAAAAPARPAAGVEPRHVWLPSRRTGGAAVLLVAVAGTAADAVAAAVRAVLWRRPRDLRVALALPPGRPALAALPVAAQPVAGPAPARPGPAGPAVTDGRTPADADAAALAGAASAALLLARYRPPRADLTAPAPVTLLTDGPAAPAVLAAVDTARVRAAAVAYARDLVHRPSADKPPHWLAAQARSLAADPDRRLSVRVWDADALAVAGFGGLLGVGGGASRPPCLVQVSYQPLAAGPGAGAAGTAAAPVVVIGKGITFDSGGLSLKPGDAMMTMKSDMAGAAAVLAAVGAAAAAGVPRPVVALLACAENMPSGTAMRPGDVLRIYGGRTVEVLNTDAEGRLVLADALAYAAAELAPAALVDVATLTGAATIGLSRHVGALFASTDGLAAGLLGAAAEAGEALWRMPLVQDYRPALDSGVADLTNTGTAGGVGAGAVTAALFLREFTAGLPWAHLDIAGPARAESDRADTPRGGTGYATATLLAWLAAGAPGAAAPAAAAPGPAAPGPAAPAAADPAAGGARPGRRSRPAAAARPRGVR